MQTTDYQTPKMQILTFEKEDVIKTSEGNVTQDDKSFDKGVKDFF